MFIGRQAGAIGIFHDCQLEIEAPNAEEAVKRAVATCREYEYNGITSVVELAEPEAVA